MQCLYNNRTLMQWIECSSMFRHSAESAYRHTKAAHVGVCMHLPPFHGAVHQFRAQVWSQSFHPAFLPPLFPTFYTAVFPLQSLHP